MDHNLLYVEAERQYRFERARADMGVNRYRLRLPSMPTFPKSRIPRRLVLTA